MFNKSHLISSGVGVVYGVLLSVTCFLFFSPRKTPNQTTPPAQPSPTEALPTRAPLPIPDAATTTPRTEHATQPAATTTPQPAATTQPAATVAPSPKKLWISYATATSYSTIKLRVLAEEEVSLSLGEDLFISPEVSNVKVNWMYWNSSIELSGDFIPETTYTITVKKGVTTRSGNYILEEDRTLTVTTPKATPSVHLYGRKGQMPFTPETSLPCSFISCDEIQMEVWRAFSNNLIHYGQSAWHDYLMEKVAEHTFKVPLNTRREQNALLPIYTLLKGKPGVYRFRVSTPNGVSSECHLILSNIGATYAYDHRNLPIVSTQHLVDGTPIVGAEVSLYDSFNQCIAHGISNEQGVTVTSLAPEATTRKEPFSPKRMIITAGEDITIVECDNATEHAAYRPTLDKMPTFPTTLWPDRDGIHPGEAVQIYGLIRTAEMDAAAAFPLTIVLESPSNNTLATEKVTSNQDGYFTTSLTIPEGGRSGYYSVLAYVGKELLASTDLYVSDFTPNHVKLGLAFAENSTEKLTLTAMTYFGSPVTQGTGSYTLTAAYAPLPKAWQNWTIGTNESKQRLRTDTFTKNSDSANLSLEGVALDTLQHFNAPVRVNASATFSEPNSRAVTTTDTFDYAHHKAYLALRYDDETQNLELKQYFPNEKEVVPGTIQKFTLKEITTDYELVREKHGWRYQWITHTTDVPLDGASAPFDTSAIQLTQETVRRSLENLAPGHYTLTATLNDTVTTSLTFWHSCYYTGEALENPSNLTFEVDKESYKPGETALVSFITPIDGRVIIMAGDKTLTHAGAMDVTAGVVTLPIEIPSTTKHGVWTVGITLVAKNINQEARYFGVAELKLDHSNHKLNLSLDLPKVTPPQQPLNLSLTLTDQKGEPCRGTVAIFAVDESILDVTGFKTPDPYQALFQIADTTFTFGDIYGTLLPQLKLGADGRIGGDSAEGLSRRKIDDTVDVSQATTVITFPLQEVDATGRLTLPVELPEFVGSLRFMAVVANGEKVGSTEHTLIVRPPVSITTAGVRYACAGDKMACTVRLINHDLPAQPYTLTMGDQTLQGEFAPGATIYHTFTLPAGETEVTLKTRDFTTSLTHHVALQEEVPLYTQTVIRQLAEGESLPADAQPLTSLAEARKVALEWLNNYSYRCTEQLSSKMLPYSFSTNPEERDIVRHLFNALMPRLQPQGGFSLWQGGYSIHVPASLFASHVLIEGYQSGILSNHNLDRILRFLEDTATSTDPDNRGEAAYAAFLLGEAKATKEAIAAARNLLVTNKTDTAAFVAAATLVFNGVADEGTPIMKAYLQQTPIPTPLLPMYMNEVAAQAMVLEFATRAGIIEDGPKRLDHLLSREWDTTQSNAWVARALAYYDTHATPTLYRQTIHTRVLQDNAPISVKKEILNREGKPQTTFTHGELAYVRLTIQTPTTISHLAIRDRLPGGFEYEDANLATRESATPPAWAKEDSPFTIQSKENLGAELRFFGEIYATETKSLIYPVRASTKGTFAIPATVAEDMYLADVVGGHDPQEMLIIQ